MSDINHAGSDLIFELEDRPPFHQALVGAITHLLAIFVPMVTPALIVGAALQLSAETTAYLVSMAMIASGIGTWLQVKPLRHRRFWFTFNSVSQFFICYGHDCAG